MSEITLRLRAFDCIRPHGPFGHTSFYTYVERGYVKLRRVGRMSFIEGFATVDELVDHLSRVVPPVGHPLQKSAVE